MELKEFLKKIVWVFLMIQAGITIAIGVVGLFTHIPNTLSPVAFFMPFVYAFFCTLVSLVTYSSKELSVRSLLIRKTIQFILIEATVLFITYSVKALVNRFMVIAVALSVFIIFVLLNLIDYFLSKAQADKMTEKLRLADQFRNADS